MNLSAPVCAKLLGDLGASVIKLERCDGSDRLRSVHVQFAGGNRGKRSIGLDLSSEETRPLVERLISDADVVVNNLRPEKSKKLGIDYQSLARVNPALVYAQVSGYGYAGPAAPWPARDPAVGAWSGWTLDGGSESLGPIWLRLLIGDTGAALVSVYGVLLALLKRELDGGGSRGTLLAAGNGGDVRVCDVLGRAIRTVLSDPGDAPGRHGHLGVVPDLSGRRRLGRGGRGRARLPGPAQVGDGSDLMLAMRPSWSLRPRR